MLWEFECGGVRQSLEAWGMVGFKVSFKNQSDDGCSFTVRGAALFDAAPLLEDGAVAKVYAGGTKVFQGKVRRNPRRATSTEDSQGFVVAGIVDSLRRTVFRQAQVRAVDPIPSALCFLNVGGMDQGAQIRQVLDWACKPKAQGGPGLDFQVGVIEVGMWLKPSQVEARSCLEVIQDQLHASPDAVLVVDYSTVSPTVHVRRWQNLPRVAVNLPGEVDEAEIDERTDLVLAAVDLWFRRTDVVDGVAKYRFFHDLYPPEADPVQEDVFPQFFDLDGGEVVKLKCECFVTPYSLLATERPGLGYSVCEAFWVQFVPAVGQSFNPKYSDLKVVDEDGTEYTGAAAIGFLSLYPNFHDGTGPIPAWLETEHGVVTRKVTISQHLEATFADDKKENRADSQIDLVVELSITNGVSRVYEVTQSVLPPEAVPTGVAQYVWETFAQLHRQGTIPITEDEINLLWRPGIRLDLNSASGRFAGMGALVQSAEWDVDKARAVMSFGPPDHLGAADLVDYLRGMRNRRMWMNPAVLASENVPDSGDVDNSTVVPARNSSSLSKFPVRIFMQKVGKIGEVDMDLDDVLGLEIKFREIPIGVKQADGSCETWYMKGLFSAPYKTKAASS